MDSFPSINFISSLSLPYFELCGRLFVQSFLRFAPHTVRLFLYCDGSLENKQLWEYVIDGNVDERVEKIDLGAVEGSKEFIDRARRLNPHYINDPVLRLRSSEYRYRFDAITFGKKGLSLVAGLSSPMDNGRFMFWIDADCIFKKPISISLLLSFLSGDTSIAYFGRKYPHSETGFIGFDREGLGFPLFLHHLRSCWHGSYEILSMSGQTDCDGFDYALEKAVHGGLKARSLSTVPEGPVIERSVLAEYIEHRKGQRKLNPDGRKG